MKSQLTTPLYPYQRDIVDYASFPAHAFYVKAGKGKTLISLEYFRLSGTNKLLIMCPNEKIDEWVDDGLGELGLHLIALNKGTANNRGLLKEEADGYVITPTNATRLKNELKKLLNKDWCIIVDESQMIKNASSGSTKTALMLGRRTDTKVLLSGTPQSKGWIDYVSQMTFLGVSDLSVTRFKEQYCHTFSMTNPQGFTFESIVGYKDNISEFESMILDHSTFYFPEDDDDFEEIIIDLPKSEAYDIMARDRVYDQVRAGYLGVLRMYLKQINSGSFNDKIIHTYKTDALISMLNEHKKEIVVIFYYTTQELNGIRAAVDHLGRPMYYYNGDDKGAREYMTSNPDKRDGAIICVQYDAGGTGLNWLVGSRVAWFHSLPDRHLPYEQARRRLARIGQNERCLFYIPVTKRTVERDNFLAISQGLDFDDKMTEEALKRAMD